MKTDNLAFATTDKDLEFSLRRLHEIESIINRSPVIYCIWRFADDAPLEYISGNVSQLGYKAEDFLSGRISWYDITHPADTDRLKFEVFKHMKDQSPMFTQIYRVFDSKGEIRWVEDQTVFIYDSEGKITHAQGSILDITVRKKAEIRLQESEDRMQELLRNSSDMVIVFNEKGLLKFVSPAAEKVLSYKPIEILGKSIFEFIHPEDIDLAIQAMDAVFNCTNPGIATELRIRKEDETWAYMEVLANNCLANPAIKGIVANMREVSERKRLEAQLYNAQKMEAIGRLTGGIAHDFNNILMGIQGYISLMLLKIDTMHPDFERMINIQTLVQSGADLTGKLLGFARGSRYELKPTDINTVLAKTVNLFGRTKKEITVHQEYEKKPWTVEVDRVQIEQVILNLLVNAWQAMPQGGDIFVRTRNCSAGDLSRTGDLPKRNYIKITVTDTGMGMDEETRKRIFEPFFTTKEKLRGVGLGLASAFGIIKEHGGFIDVTSKPQQGTTFAIYLPTSDKKVPKEVYTAKTILTGKESILLVDDEISIIEVCRDILVNLGYKIHTAGSGQEAVDTYKAHKDGIDLVILDMIMPGMNGNETYRQLKAVNPDVRVILSTGYSGSDQAQQILDNGCQAMIQKPFRVDDLSQKIREVLDRKNRPARRASVRQADSLLLAN